MPQSHHAESPLPNQTAPSAASVSLDAALLRRWPLPLDARGDKMTRGTVLVIAGSPTTAGAALLAGTAALRMGAGRLQIATAAPIAAGLSIALPEAMVLPIEVDDAHQFRPESAAAALDAHIGLAQAVLIGPGMVGDDEICAIVEFAVERMAPDAVLAVDAAALRSLASISPSARRSIAARLVLTPNRDELDVLVAALQLDDHGDHGDPLAAAAEALGAAVTCFGDVASHDGRRWHAPAATPGLGTSGSGDVLAGLAVGAAARCGDAAHAACWATHVHAAAGNRLSERLGITSFIARELLDEVPHVLAGFD